MRVAKAYLRALNAFTRWFSGPSCFWQTTVLLLFIASAELTDPRIDPHGFWLLWALTLFSAWTQPALAFSNEVAAKQMEEVLERLERMEQQMLTDLEGKA